MTTALAAIAFLATLLEASRRARRALHMWQMDSYLSARYVRWMAAKPFARWIDPLSILLAAGLAPAVYLIPPAAPLLVWSAWNLYRFFRTVEPEAKKPLDYTARARRTLWTARGLLAALAAAFAWTGAPPIPCGLILLLAAPWSVLAANVLLKPVQARINRGFIRKAAARLAELDPLVVGIAGSYGKTSTKYFLEVLLRGRFSVLKSPGNYNTLLGMTRVVNEMLEPEHKILIAEMGAYRRGEVAEVCQLVHPRIGIVTSIGPEHFERFLTLENIERTNYELVEALPQGGLAVFNGASEHCRKLAARTRHTRVSLYGIDAPGVCDIWAENVVHSREGLRFTIVTRQGQRAAAAAPLAGRHMVLNILGAARVALELGVPIEEVVLGIAALKPAPHRLEIKQGAGGTTIIDDSYNSNPIGAAEALYVLSQYRDARRILVTPGMIELGVLHEEENRKLGRLAAESADFIFLVGPEQTQPVQEGLREAGFPESSLRVVKDLAEVTAALPALLRAGDVILFENDLPDLYSEE